MRFDWFNYTFERNIGYAEDQTRSKKSETNG